MGNDGGSIPGRRDLVKEAARRPTTTQIKETRKEQQEHLWKTDPLKHRLLAKPVVSDSLGRLFNKDSVIEFLLPAEEEDRGGRKEQEELLGGNVKGLKDVVEVKFKESDEGGGKWVCPVTSKELGAATKSVYLVPCGHAFAEAAIREVAEEKCLQCGESYAPNDAIPILPTLDTDIARLMSRMETLREKGLTHSLKKASGGHKKRKKAESDSPVVLPGSTKNINDAATASLTAKVMEEQGTKKRKTLNKNLDSLFSANSDVPRKDGKNTDFMSRGFAIPGK